MNPNQPAEKIPMPLPLADVEAVLAEAKLHWPKKQLPPLTAREVDALKRGAKIIPLTQGRWAIVDAEDYDGLLWRSWCACKMNKVFYAVSSYSIAGKQHPCSIHRLVMDSPGGIVDHKNHDGLDNRRGNLRVANNSQNNFNRGMMRNNTSGFRGVRYRKRSGKYEASIAFNRRRIYLGCNFTSAEEAFEAYRLASIHYHGEFAGIQ